MIQDKTVEKQNVTLSLPKNVLREAKKIAIDRDTSLSGLMAELLLELVEKRDEYEAAKQRYFDIMDEGHELGLHGKIPWTRDELHDRRY